MKIDRAAAGGCALFRGIAPEELERALDCMGAYQREFPAGAYILRAGEPADRIGVLLRGEAQIVREEYDGSRTIVARAAAGELFGETFACAARDALPVSVLSVAGSAVLFLDYRRAVAVCPSACPYHGKLVENMLAVLAEKNLLLNRRLVHLSRRSTREKLLSFLAEEAGAAGEEFAVPFDRQGMADYLCVDRSAMSAALSALRREGLVRYRKNRFVLLAPPGADSRAAPIPADDGLC